MSGLLSLVAFGEQDYMLTHSAWSLARRDDVEALQKCSKDPRSGIVVDRCARSIANEALSGFALSAFRYMVRRYGVASVCDSSSYHILAESLAQNKDDDFATLQGLRLLREELHVPLTESKTETAHRRSVECSLIRNAKPTSLAYFVTARKGCKPFATTADLVSLVSQAVRFRPDSWPRCFRTFCLARELWDAPFSEAGDEFVTAAREGNACLFQYLMTRRRGDGDGDGDGCAWDECVCMQIVVEVLSSSYADTAYGSNEGQAECLRVALAWLTSSSPARSKALTPAPLLKEAVRHATRIVPLPFRRLRSKDACTILLQARKVEHAMVLHEYGGLALTAKAVRYSRDVSKSSFFAYTSLSSRMAAFFSYAMRHGAPVTKYTCVAAAPRPSLVMAAMDAGRYDAACDADVACSLVRRAELRTISDLTDLGDALRIMYAFRPFDIPVRLVAEALDARTRGHIQARALACEMTAFAHTCREIAARLTPQQYATWWTAAFFSRHQQREQHGGCDKAADATRRIPSPLLPWEKIAPTSSKEYEIQQLPSILARRALAPLNRAARVIAAAWTRYSYAPYPGRPGFERTMASLMQQTDRDFLPSL